MNRFAILLLCLLPLVGRSAQNDIVLFDDYVKSNSQIITTNETMDVNGVKYTHTNAPTAANYILEYFPASSTAQFVAKSSAGTFDHTSLTNVNGDADVQHLTAAEKGIATNDESIALHAESNLYQRVDGTNVYYGESVTVVAGVTAGTYFDGANGAAISAAVDVAVGDIGTNASNITVVSNAFVAADSNQVPQPTNTWVAEYVLSSGDGGTTTYAVAGGGSGISNLIQKLGWQTGSFTSNPNLGNFISFGITNTLTNYVSCASPTGETQRVTYKVQHAGDSTVYVLYWSTNCLFPGGWTTNWPMIQNTNAISVYEFQWDGEKYLYVNGVFDLQ